MTLQVSTTINDIEVKGPFSNKKTGSEFDAHIFKTSEGDFTQYVNVDKEPDVLKGDNVEIFFNEVPGYPKGTTLKKVVKIQKVSSIKSSPTKLLVKPEQLPEAKKALKVTGFTASTVIPNKDISMEVSGLLQALISTGQYNKTKEGGGTFLAEELLEKHLSLALNLKRKIAQELENTGKV